MTMSTNNIKYPQFPQLHICCCKYDALCRLVDYSVKSLVTITLQLQWDQIVKVSKYLNAQGKGMTEYTIIWQKISWTRQNKYVGVMEAIQIVQEGLSGVSGVQLGTISGISPPKRD